MLETAFPVPQINSPIRIGVLPVAVLLVLAVAALVPPSVIPLVEPVPVHHARAESSLVLPSVGPREGSLSVHFVELPVPLELGTVSPEIETKAVLLAKFVGSFVEGAVVPELDSEPLVHIFLENPLGRNRGTRKGFEEGEVVTGVLLPLSQNNLKLLWVFVQTHFEDTLSKSFAVMPITLKPGAVWELKTAVAVFG